MDTKTLIPAIRAGFDLIQRLEPMAALGGPAAAGLANVITGLSEIGEAALDNAERSGHALSGNDQDELRELVAQLSAIARSNDAAVRAS